MGRKNRDFSNYAFVEATKEYIHSSRDRKMIIMFYVDDKTYDELCEIFSLSLSQVKRILAKGGETVFRHISYK